MADLNEQYKDQLVGLLPPGAALENTEDSDLGDMLAAAAMEFARVHARAQDLIRESDPRTCYETLPDWERCYGLPDECTAETPTAEERRNLLTAKVVAKGGQSRSYFKRLAAALGYDVEIEEYDRAHVGNRVGVRCGGVEWVHTFAVIAPETTIRYARASSACCGERLSSWGDSALECVIARAKPAHATVIHIYG